MPEIDSKSLGRVAFEADEIARGRKWRGQCHDGPKTCVIFLLIATGGRRRVAQRGSASSRPPVFLLLSSPWPVVRLVWIPCRTKFPGENEAAGPYR